MLLKEKLLSTTYLGATCYYSEIIQEKQITIEVNENFNKQTLRNRCYILGPNGPQILNIPILKGKGKQAIKDTQISYAENWQKQHWKSLQTAYGSSPFFEVLAPELQPFYEREEKYLLDLNNNLMKLMLEWLQVDLKVLQTERFQPVGNSEKDIRFKYDTKDFSKFSANPYHQINGNKENFYANLSVIDLLFNEGPMAWEYLILKSS